MAKRTKNDVQTGLPDSNRTTEQLWGLGMKLEWIERDRDGHEVRTALRKLEPLQEVPVAESCAIRLVSDQTSECTLQIVRVDPSVSTKAPPSPSTPSLLLLRSQVAEVLHATEAHLSPLSNAEVRALAVLLIAPGKRITHHSLAMRLGGLFDEPTAEDIAALVGGLEQNLVQSGISARLEQHPSGAVALRV